MELRPMTIELMYHCANTDYCRNCCFRVGCSQRYKFYLESQEEFELWLQMVEIKMNYILNPDKSASIADNLFKAADRLRRKVNDEKTIHPVFSYI